jgi:hypothetical protein
MIFAGDFPLSIITFLVITFILSVVVEAVTEILVASELTDPLRRKWKEWTYPVDAPPPDTYFQKFKVWFDKLISCGYCTSVWVAGFFGIWAPKFDFGYWLIDWIVIVFALHRVATWIHVVYELIRKGRVKTHDLEVKVLMQDSEDYDGSVGEGSFEESAEAESGGDEAGGSSDTGGH